jgi:hypothetical protein
MVTASVPDLEGVAGAWIAGTDYEVVERRTVSSELEMIWGTAPAAHPWTVLTRAPGSTRGLVRLVAGTGRRPDRPFYSVRGPMAVEFFARDASAVHERFNGTPFQAITAPVDYDLTSIGSGRVQSVGFCAPGGWTVFVSTMKWVPPPRQLPVVSQHLGPAINVPIVALDRERSNEFYSGLLGISVRFDGPVQDADVNRIMGAPSDLAYHITVFFIADGQMAEHHFHDSRRVVEEPAPEGRLRSGAVGSTFRVEGLDPILTQARAMGYAPRGPVTPDVEPYGPARVAGLTGPNGELVELVEG